MKIRTNSILKGQDGLVARPNPRASKPTPEAADKQQQEMNAMIGSVNEQEIPTVALENMMESGVTALVIDFTTGPDVIGQVSLDSEGYSTHYDMQNPHTSVCLNVGSRGDLTSFTTFDMSFETNREFTYSLFQKV